MEPRTLLTTTFYWDPSSGNNIDAIQYINGYPYLVNWDEDSFGSGMHPTSLPSGTGVTLVFDGRSNANCNVDTNLSGSIVLQNGYTAAITISDNTTLTEYGYTDNSIPADFFNVGFGGANAVQNYETGQTPLGNFSWKSGGKTTVNGATVFIGMQSGLSQTTDSPLYINSGSVNIGPSNGTSGTSTFNLTSGSADIIVNANGLLQFHMPTDKQTLVENSGTAAWINNNGGITLVNTPGGGQANFDAPLENHATLDASHGGYWSFSTADANNNDLYMDAGTITLGNNVTLYCLHAYTQTAGTLTITDTQPSNTLEVIGSGAAYFNGGKINFTSASGYGTLELGKVIFNGVEIDMRIDGTNGFSDKMKPIFGGLCEIDNTSALVVKSTANPVQPGRTWTLIQPNPGNNITGTDFGTVNLPPKVLEKKSALPLSWQCGS